MNTLQLQSEIKAVIDEFAILADVKNIAGQMPLFTEDTKVVVNMNGETVFDIDGTEQLQSTFEAFMEPVVRCFHMNGQAKITINEDGTTASAISYSKVELVTVEEGNEMLATNSIIYNDEFALVDGKWLITKRMSNFNITNKFQLNA